MGHGKVRVTESPTEKRSSFNASTELTTSLQSTSSATAQCAGLGTKSPATSRRSARASAELIMLLQSISPHKGGGAGVTVGGPVGGVGVGVGVGRLPTCPASNAAMVMSTNRTTSVMSVKRRTVRQD